MDKQIEGTLRSPSLHSPLSRTPCFSLEGAAGGLTAFVRLSEAKSHCSLCPTGPRGLPRTTLPGQASELGLLSGPFFPMPLSVGVPVGAGDREGP